MALTAAVSTEGAAWHIVGLGTEIPRMSKGSENPSSPVGVLCSFIAVRHSFNKHSLNACCVPRPVLDGRGCQAE